MSRDNYLKLFKKYRTLLLIILGILVPFLFSVIIYYTRVSENAIALILGITFEIMCGAIFEVLILVELYKEIQTRKDLYSTIWMKTSKIKPIHILGELRSREDKGFYNDLYFKDRDEERELHKNLRIGLKQLALSDYKKRENVIIIIGAPLSGKSRMIYEWLKKQEKTIITILKPAEQIDKINTKFRLIPYTIKRGTKKIILIDNIHTYINKINFDLLIKQFLNSKTMLILISRSGFEFDKIKRKSKIYDFIKLSLFKEIYIKRIDRSDNKTYQALNKYISSKLDKNLSEFNFDGNIGSIFLDLDEIRNRCEKLSEENPKIRFYLETISIAYAFDLFKGEGAFPKEWLFNIYSNFFYREIEKGDLLNIIKKLLHSEIAYKEDRDNIFIEPVYIEKIFLKDNLTNIILENSKHIMNIFQNNPNCLHFIGTSCIEIYALIEENEQLLDIAINCYEIAFQKYGFYSDYLFLNLGYAYSNKKMYEKGEEILLRCLEENPDFAEAYISLGAIKVNTGNSEEGIKYLNIARNLGADNFELYFAYGKAYYNLLGFEEAEKYFLLAFEKKQNAQKILTSLILLYAEMRNLTKALKYFKKAINLNSVNYEAYVNIGLAFSRKNKNKKAIEYYKTAFRINPDRVEALNNLGVVYQLLKDYRKAILYFKKALMIRPNSFTILGDLNTLYELIGDKEKAREYLEIIIKTNPKNLSSVLEKTEILVNNEEYQIALDFLNEITPEYKNESVIYFVIARIYSRLNKKNEALKNLKKAIKLDPIRAKKYAKEISDFDDLRKYDDFKKLLE